MSAPSIRHQVKSALELVFVSNTEKQTFQADEGLKQVLGVEKYTKTPAYSACLEICVEFFQCARELSGKKLLSELFVDTLLRETLDTYYTTANPETLFNLFLALTVLHHACRRRRWVKGHCPINAQLSRHMRAYPAAARPAQIPLS